MSVAIVGADGSGKTSVASAILDEHPTSMKYVYMGPAIGSSSHALPTSRLIAYIRKRAIRPMLDSEGRMPPAELMPEKMKAKLHRGHFLKVLGLLNRVAEEWYRQIIVWGYRLRGYSVLCDRHYLFEYCPASLSSRRPDTRLTEKIHSWQLSRFYPEPDVVIFLDADAEILNSRKPEWTLGYLVIQRARIQEQGQATSVFVVIDAGLPFKTVVEEVTKCINKFAGC